METDLYTNRDELMATEIYNTDRMMELIAGANTINEANYQYYRNNEEQLEKEYGGRIIVIIEQEVVTAREFTANLTESRDFVQSLPEEFGQEAVREAYITYVPDPEQRLVL